MKVLIVGAGMGGLTLATFLKKLNIDFDIIEKSPDWNKQGYSLGVWDNGRDILRKLGLENEFDTSGERIKKFIISDGSGKILRTHNLEEFYTAYGSAYTHLNRKKLHSWLLAQVGVDKVKMNSPISDPKQIAGYDVVVGADGAHSQVRRLFFTDTDCEHYSEWRAWFLRLEATHKTERSAVQYIEPGQLVSVFDDKDEPLAVFVAPIPHTQWDEETGRVDRLKKLFDRHTKVSELLQNATDRDITPTNLSSVDMNKWVKGNVVLLGDAAHAMGPFAGLGASMAMEDAYVLASELFKVREGTQSIPEALANYEKKRKVRVKLAQRATASMRWWAQSTSPLLIWLVKLFAPYSPVGYFTKNFHKLLRQEI